MSKSAAKTRSAHQASSINIWWIRRDLRIADNPALHAALEAGESIIPLYILDPGLQKSNYVGDKRQAFLYANLYELNQRLAELGGRLIIRQGNPVSILAELIEETGARSIFAQEDISPYAIARDSAVSEFLPLILTDGLTIHPPQAIRKMDGAPYTVYTPYSKTWKTLPLPNLQPTPKRISVPNQIMSLPLPEAQFNTNRLPFPAGEHEAQRRLGLFLSGAQPPVASYQEARNRMDLEGTSSLSPYIRFGLLSPRQAVAAALDRLEVASSTSEEEGIQTWINELIWREFFISILANFPEVRRMSFRQDLRAIPWQNDLAEFDAWAQGETGYPVVDAGMRQLLESGWMHNRARMITASFLVKDLLIDWRWGERWFMQHLLDGDPAANNGGWQWTAGTGTDAAPYFRIFNPILQSKKFDPKGDYIRRWIPELGSLPSSFIHEPWRLNSEQQHKYGVKIGVEYPTPIIDHQFARRRTLDAYKRTQNASS